MKARREIIRPLHVGEHVKLILGEPGSCGSSSIEVVVAAVNNRAAILERSNPADRIEQDFIQQRRARPATVTASRSSGLSVYCGRIQPRGTDHLAFSQTKAPLGVQRRRDFRLPLARTVAITRTSAGKSDSVRAQLVDLSGGGAQIEVDRQYSVGEIVQFSAPFGDCGDEEMIGARVLACAPSSTSSARNTVRLTFDDDNGRVRLPEALRDEIVRYLFARQREMLKLRKLLAPSEGKPKTKPRGLAALLARMRGVS